MIDLKWLREHPEAFDRALARRGQPPAAAGLLELDAARRELETRLQQDQATRNRLSREIGQGSSQGRKPAPQLLAEMGALKERVKTHEAELRELDQKLETRASEFPNVLSADVPEGRDESANVVLRTWGAPREFDFTPADHEEIGKKLGMDFTRAAKLAGTRFVVLRGQLALLERALTQFMLDLHTQEHGYTEYYVPLLVHRTAAWGTGQLPKFEEDLFQTQDGRILIPTAEVSLTNLVAGGYEDEADLPLRLTAGTPCFRAEAGAAGKDTRGMVRQHQFNKVELVSITTPEQSDREHERLTSCAEEVLQQLQLPYRVMLLCSGDTGFSARKTYDIEVWLPGQARFREISSCSNCGDFQARRMKARYRGTDGKIAGFVHTLNGSGLAVGRTLIAVLENHQQADGSVTVPAALRPFLHGRERLVPGEH